MDTKDLPSNLLGLIADIGANAVSATDWTSSRRTKAKRKASTVKRNKARKQKQKMKRHHRKTRR
jgi:hypothetical protein